jgi:hypothetical protein
MSVVIKERNGGEKQTVSSQQKRSVDGNLTSPVSLGPSVLLTVQCCSAVDKDPGHARRSTSTESGGTNPWRKAPLPVDINKHTANQSLLCVPKKRSKNSWPAEFRSSAPNFQPVFHFFFWVFHRTTRMSRSRPTPSTRSHPARPSTAVAAPVWTW